MFKLPKDTTLIIKGNDKKITFSELEKHLEEKRKDKDSNLVEGSKEY